MRSSPRAIAHSIVARLYLICLAACADEPHAGGVHATPNGDRQCVPDRMPLPDPDGSHRQSLAWLEQRYPIAGRFGEAGLVGVSPSDAPASGELVVELLPRELTRLTGCQDGVEAFARIELHTDDGALDEALEGTVVVHAALLEPAEPDVTYDRTAVLQATLDMTALRGDLSWPDDSEWTYDRGLLRASLSPWGSQGELHVSPVPRDPSELDQDEVLASPPVAPIVSWPSESRCGESVQAWTPGDGEPAQTLAARIAQLNEMSVPVRYTGEPDGMAHTELQVELEPPTDLCGYSLRRSRARLRTGDGRVDLTVDVAINLEFPSLLFFNTYYETDYAYPPALFAEHVGHVDAELTDFAHVGTELWFDHADVMRGELKVVGWSAGGCLLCEGDGCYECSAENRSLILGLAIIAPAPPRPSP